MSNEVEVYESQPIDIIRSPKEAITEARNAAKELQAVVAGKKKPVIFNGEQYLEFEDWQTVGNFYGLTAKIINTSYIEYGTVRGFEARAVALNRYGAEVSAAESMCLNDEANWKNKPLFQLRSMAQTRACAKALRNTLAWVVVLAGYKPSVAEEMTGDEKAGGNGKPPMKPPQEKKAAPPASEGEPTARDKLKQELLDYCSVMGELDPEMMKDVMLEITSFTGKDGNTQSFSADEIELYLQDGSPEISDKWIRSALGKLRKLVEANKG